MKSKTISFFSCFAILSFMSLFIYGCYKKDKVEPQDKKPVSNSISNAQLVSNDQDYKDYLKDFENFLNKEKNIPTIEKLINKPTLTNDEKEQFSKALGFKSQDEFEQFVIEQNKRIKTLDVKYQLKSNPEKSLFNFIGNTMLIQKGLSDKKLMVDMETVGNVGPCETRRRNCLIIASAAAIAGHLACASVDIATAGIGAFICHGAVILANSAANSNCLLDYDECITKSVIKG